MTQKLPGVYAARKKDNSLYYRASLTFRERHISLGSYNQAEQAHLAYQEGLKLVNSLTALTEYSPQSPLSFLKWVILINFRDHGLYFSMPIYLKNKYFLYYLDSSYILKFDIDDLFYYSTKKIMRRGGHLFVNDYGMQFNILNRYGIRSYAVLNRDYRFLNGDSQDLRYENIEIINRFYGITHTPVKNGSQPLYKVRLHIRSSYVVGVYTKETEAAIAYNKAVDIVKKNGIDRNFPLNYIEGLSPATYAHIYSLLPIADKIYTLTPQNT
ncbi:MAG: hypothetical protein IKM28_09435 [Lachnospiraceae bacterium]|nr:hypothetical protein [Lachnospiraceae bacterium]